MEMEIASGALGLVTAPEASHTVSVASSIYAASAVAGAGTKGGGIGSGRTNPRTSPGDTFSTALIWAARDPGIKPVRFQSQTVEWLTPSMAAKLPTLPALSMRV